MSQGPLRRAELLRSDAPVRSGSQLLRPGPGALCACARPVRSGAELLRSGSRALRSRRSALLRARTGDLRPDVRRVSRLLR